MQKKIEKLYRLWKDGVLGGNFMPEDSNPDLDRLSNENLIYFTLPMALNYQRNSYKLWESAKKTYLDPETIFVFDPQKVIDSNFELVQYALLKHKLALQPIKQTQVWIKLCETFLKISNGNIFNFLFTCDFDIIKIKNYMQVTNKKDFPYLSGNKICNYWLYVLLQYTNFKFINKSAITIAPDTHIIQSSIKLGIISLDESNCSNIQEIVVSRWEKLLKNSHFDPIDLHTPLWLWSRGGFSVKI